QPPTHLVVVDVEAERERLAVVNLVADRRLEQRLELVAGRLASVETPRRIRDAVDDELVDHDAIGRFVVAAAPCGNGEQQRAEHEKMQQRIFQDSDRHRHPPGGLHYRTPGKRGTRQAGAPKKWCQTPFSRKLVSDTNFSKKGV